MTVFSECKKFKGSHLDAAHSSGARSTCRVRRPKYLQLAEQIQAQVEAGVRQPGERLPSFAQMQAEHNLSQSTLEKMYGVLEQQKLIVREPGRGVYIAQQQRTQAGVIGLLANHAPESHPYYSHLLAGMREAARREGMEVLLLNDVNSVNWEKVDGVVICFGYAKDIFSHLPPGLPCVAILYPVEGVSTVATDDYHGMSEAVKHLLELGHRRIGYLTVAASQGSDSLSQCRLRAYRDTLAAHQVAIEPGWIQPLYGPYEPLRKFADAGRDKMRRWLADGWNDLGLTALLAQNDDVAIGAVEALEEAAVEVPGQVSIVGFDGTEMTEYFRPRLTTVQVPLHEIGATGTQKLIEQMKRPAGETQREAATTLLSPRLKIGDSTRPLSQV